jgi:hypothetical protein
MLCSEIPAFIVLAPKSKSSGALIKEKKKQRKKEKSKKETRKKEKT